MTRDLRSLEPLDPEVLHHALAYYHDHPEEMRMVEKRRRELHEAAAEDPTIITGPKDLSDS